MRGWVFEGAVLKLFCCVDFRQAFQYSAQCRFQNALKTKRNDREYMTDSCLSNVRFM